MRTLLLIFQCTPISYFWDKQTVKGRCIKQNIFNETSGVITMLMVTGLLFLPAPLVWKLHLPKWRKWGLSVAFAVGGL